MVNIFFIKIFCVVQVFILVLCSNVIGQTASQIAKKSFSSVVMLVLEDSHGQPFSLGSGFFVKHDVVATNLHVVKGAMRGYAKIVDQKTKYDIAGIVGIDEFRDLVLLKLNRARAPALPFGDSKQVGVGDEVYVISNPMGLEGTFSMGIVSGVRQIGADTLFQITAPISPGSSGGPVINKEGHIIGVAVATVSGGQNLNFAIPSSYLIPLISHINPATSLSSLTSLKRKKSILDNLGKRSSEGVTAGNMRWTYKYSQSGNYSFSINNRLRESVKNVYCLIIFYDNKQKPIEIDVVQFNGIIPGGLARRVTSKVHGSIQELTTSTGTSTTKLIEFRVLDFRIVN